MAYERVGQGEVDPDFSDEEDPEEIVEESKRCFESTYSMIKAGMIGGIMGLTYYTHLTLKTNVVDEPDAISPLYVGEICTLAGATLAVGARMAMNFFNQNMRSDPNIDLAAERNIAERSR